MIPQEPISQVLVFANQSQQQVLGFDRRATKLASLVASEENDPSGSLCISFKHKFLILSNAGNTAVTILIDAHKSNNIEIYAVFRKTPPSNSQTSSHWTAMRSLWVTITEVRPFSWCNSRKIWNMWSPVR